MSSVVKRADYDATLAQTVTLDDYLPPDHRARFIANVIIQLDFAAFYQHYGPRGAWLMHPNSGSAYRSTAMKEKRRHVLGRG